MPRIPDVRRDRAAELEDAAELEAAHQALRLAKADRRLGDFLLRLRETEGCTWRDALARLRRHPIVRQKLTFC